MFDALRTHIELFLSRNSIPSPWGVDLLDNITVLAGGLSILFLVLAVMARRAPRSARESDKPIRTLIKKARKAERKENYREAGDYYLAARHYMNAAKVFVQIEDFGKAAEACLLNNDYNNAGKCLVRIGEHARAAELFLKGRDYSNAAQNLERVGRLGEAAPLYDRGGHPDKAARCYASIGFHQKAGEMMAHAGEYAQAAPYLLRTLQERNSRRDPSLAVEEDAVSGNIALLSAECYLKTGQKLKAAQSLELGGLFSRSGSLFEELGEKSKASELYIRGKDTTSAARVLESSDYPGENALNVAEALLEEGKPLEAAELFAKLGEWNRAAGLFLENDLKDLAVEAFVQSGNPQSAADLLVEMGRSSEAASMLMEAGKPEAAARIYGKMGEKERELEALIKADAHFHAAKHLVELGREDEATEELQKVEPGDRDFREANLLLGELFFNKEQWSIAIASYQKALSDENVARDNLEAYYRYASSLKEDGQVQGALSIFEKILLVDYHFRDAKDQVLTLKKVLESSSQELSSPFLPSSPDATMVAGGGNKSSKSSRYQILAELGRGGMGVVYKATDTLLDRIVAYKVLPPHVQKEQKVLEMFLREARSAARLSHPNIVTIFDADEDRGEFFIIMELVEGQSLKEILEQQGKLPVKTALVLAAQIFKALSYAHSKGIVHRDIKPANLLWEKSEKLVKITDFGLARVIEEGRKTHTQMAGTPYYMAPEQITGGIVDHQADQYALGITLYEFVTGTVPFKDGDVLYHHVHTQPTEPDKHNPDLPEALSAFIMKCIAKDPAQRFPDANAALQDLKQLLT